MIILKYIWKKRGFIAITALVFTVLFYVYACFNTYYRADGELSFLHPNAENGKYPDGIRFNIYDLASDEVLNNAVRDYNEKTGGKPIYVDDVKKHIQLSEIVPSGIQNKVLLARSSGQDYSYFANEYRISITPIRKVNNAGISNLFGFIPEVDTKALLNCIYKSYTNYFMDQHAEINIIPRISQNIDYNGYDYIEIADVFDKKIQMFINYLKGKNDENGLFVSSGTNMSFNDLISEFTNLSDIKVKNLRSFVASSKLAKDPVGFINKLEVENESNKVYYNKTLGEAEFARKAMNEYDHTFEENIVITGKNDKVGLYQARPKTAYDTITKRALDKGVLAQNILEDINNSNTLIKEYGSAVLSDKERARLSQIADDMVKDIESDVESLTRLADTTVTDYLLTKCGDYIKTTISPKSYINFGIIMKTGIVFAFSLLFALAIVYLFDTENKYGLNGIRDSLGIRSRKRIKEEKARLKVNRGSYKKRRKKRKRDKNMDVNGSQQNGNEVLNRI